MLRAVYAYGRGSPPMFLHPNAKTCPEGRCAVCLRSDIDDFGRMSVVSVYERHSCGRPRSACRSPPLMSRIVGANN